MPVVSNQRNGFKTTIRKKDSSGNVVTVAASGLETINGAASVNLVSQGDYVELIGDQTEWNIGQIRATYESSLETITAGGLLTLAHGLGVRPFFV